MSGLFKPLIAQSRRQLGFSPENSARDRREVAKHQADYTQRFGLLAAKDRYSKRDTTRQVLKGQTLGGGDPG